MAHIAMVSIPFPGHVNPSLEIIRALAGRGHRVTYANAASYGPAVREVGAELKAYVSTLPPAGREWDPDLVEQLTLFLDDAIAMLPQLRELYAADRPDLFLYDIAGAPARLLAEEWGIPAIQLSPTFVAWEGYADEMPPPDERMRAYLRRFSSWLAENGSSTTDSMAFQGRPSRALALIPRALQPNADRVDTSVTSFVGPVLRSFDQEWTRPSDAGRVLLVSLGSTFTRLPDFYRRCVQAFGPLPGWHVVLQIGRHVDPASLGELPPGIEVHRWVPQLSVLSQADAFLTHAGMGGSSEGLCFGTPMIAAPQAADQFANAAQLESLGVARVVDSSTVTADELRAALLSLVDDPAVAARSAAIAAEVREQGGVSRAADLIEAQLTGG